jgi:hypothetical protein
MVDNFPSLSTIGKGLIFTVATGAISAGVIGMGVSAFAITAIAFGAWGAANYNFNAKLEDFKSECDKVKNNIALIMN